MHEQSEEGHEVRELGRLKLGNDMAHKRRNELSDGRADSINKLGEGEPGGITDVPARLHGVQRLEERLGHLLERRLVCESLELRVRDLREALGEVTEREQVVVHLQDGLQLRAGVRLQACPDGRHKWAGDSFQ